MTVFPALFSILAALYGSGPQLSLSPNLEVGGGYDSNILFQSSGGPRGYFNQTSARFDLNFRLVKRITFDTDYEILYANYSAGVFSSLDNFLFTGLSLRTSEYFTVHLDGQWENFSPVNKPEYAFSRLSALPSCEVTVKGIVARGAVYYSSLEFPGRTVNIAGGPAEKQIDREIDSLVLLGYTFRGSTAMTVTYVYSVIRSNFLSSDDHLVLNSYGNTAALNIWQTLWKRARANLRFEAVSRIFVDNSPTFGVREDMGYKTSLIFRHGFTVNLEGFISTSYFIMGSTNPNEAFKRFFITAGVTVLFHPLIFERLWKEDF